MKVEKRIYDMLLEEDDDEDDDDDEECFFRTKSVQNRSRSCPRHQLQGQTSSCQHHLYHSQNHTNSMMPLSRTEERIARHYPSSSSPSPIHLAKLPLLRPSLSENFTSNCSPIRRPRDLKCNGHSAFSAPMAAPTSATATRQGAENPTSALPSKESKDMLLIDLPLDVLPSVLLSTNNKTESEQDLASACAVITPCACTTSNDETLQMFSDIQEERIEEQLLKCSRNIGSLNSSNLLQIFDNLDTFVKLPAPQGITLRCRVTRDRQGINHGLYPTYYFHLERRSAKKIFLLAARKRKRSASANYLISTDPTDLSRYGASYVAKLRSNVVGTQFTLYDNGQSPKRNFRTPEFDNRLRQELCSIIYEPNILGIKGPRKLTILLPSLAEGTVVPKMEFRPMCRRQTLIWRWKMSRDDGISVFINKSPLWNEDLQAFVLNFHGRVTEASVKNFQIITQDNPDQLIMQFGRVGDDLFTLDFSYPMTPLQAFGIALSSFDSKIACE